MPSNRRRWNAGDTGTLVAGIFTFVQFNFVGQLLAADLYLLVCLAIVATKRAKPLWRGRSGSFLSLCIIWLVAQIITDLAVGSEAADFLRGWAKIVFTITSFSALYLLLLGRESRVLIYATGLAISQVIKYFVAPDPNVVDDIWKWGVGSPITSILVILASTFAGRSKKTLALAALAIATFLNFYFNYRSAALFSFITFSAVLTTTENSSKKGARRTPYVLGGLALGAVVFQVSYIYAASNGLLGPAAKQKYEQQSAGDLGGIIGGRAEILASVQAIQDSPIIGHGSWARDFRYVNILRDLYLTHGYGNYPVYGDTIPAHSHMLGAWVEAGIFGALFWLWVFFLAVKGTLRASFQTTANSTFAVFAGLNLMWDILFSPYGADRTVITPFLIVVMMFALRSTPKEIRKRKPLPVFAHDKLDTITFYDHRNRYDLLQPRQIPAGCYLHS